MQRQPVAKVSKEPGTLGHEVLVLSTRYRSGSSDVDGCLTLDVIWQQSNRCTNPERKGAVMTVRSDSVVVPARWIPRRSVADLIESARRGLWESSEATSAPERYIHAHLAALRAGAAVVAAKATPSASGSRSGKPSNLWALLAEVAPDLGEWAAYFEAGASRRAAAEAGLGGAVTERQADDLVRDSARFLSLVETRLAVPAQLQLS